MKCLLMCVILCVFLLWWEHRDKLDLNTCMGIDINKVYSSHREFPHDAHGVPYSIFGSLTAQLSEKASSLSNRTK